MDMRRQLYPDIVHVNKTPRMSAKMEINFPPETVARVENSRWLKIQAGEIMIAVLCSISVERTVKTEAVEVSETSKSTLA